MMQRTRTGLIALLIAACLVMVLASLMIGRADLSVGQVWREWRSGLSPSEAPALGILVQQRLPRTLAALLAGCGLALAGCAFQALLRNPLATPYTLGIASAGAFGAWTATILVQGFGYSLAVLGPRPVQMLAFLCAALDMAIVYGLAARGKRLSPAVLLLAGVTLGMLANAGILLMRYLADPERLVQMDRWLMGGVDVLGSEPITILFVGVVPCSLVLLAQGAKYDQLSFGAEMAAGRGVHVRRLQLVTFIIGSLMTAVIVSVVGPIGFVGLIVPHAVRSISGSRHRILMPLSALAGGAFLCLCDIIARKVATGEFPIGIITSLAGGPFFLYLLMRRRFTDWEM
ncbi:MAG TPA: iron ABC transporter permease [Candidatus Hydrogenedentes bacterium]|nr:iron ABC transporter permease [Candidatus Hydrogenedentota bacterium]